MCRSPDLALSVKASFPTLSVGKEAFTDIPQQDSGARPVDATASSRGGMVERGVVRSDRPP
ncbi:hypothetical protein HDA45_002468 [Amycolatopsis umgeniensis]|uniref:Uncharacterized protein n=1 Tax=Amycolatopsis umgeniensis TaxID=336628 RepID=A0A841B0H3_9PSEU|nr:hypothetical protein [Amycolatopsis umgeniensis]